MISKSPLKIAIASGKGGTGKTLLSTNLAAYLSEFEPTLLVDLDVEEPNDALFINAPLLSTANQHKMIPVWNEQECILCGKCARVCKFHAVVQLGKTISVFNQLCHSCYACSELCPTNALPMQTHKMGETRFFEKGNLSFTESRLVVGEEQAVPLINKTHSIAQQKYNHIKTHLLDCPPGTSCPVVAATKDAHYVILVTEPTPFGLNDLALAVETMRQLGKDFGVVINREGHGNSSVKEYCQREQIPVIASIPFQREIAELYSTGQLVYSTIPAVRQALERIALVIKEKGAVQ